MAVASRIQGTPSPVKGVRFAAVQAGIRYPNRTDLVLFQLAPGSQVAAVFTRNAFCAAPVQVARLHLQEAVPRYLLINTGNANAGTGARGLGDARACCDALAAAASKLEETVLNGSDILPFSTGVIGEPLPVARITSAIPRALASLQDNDWMAVARGIMTTDTRPKAVSCEVSITADSKVTVTGIAKGAGMIKPNMATMLAFVFTDAQVERTLLQEILGRVVNKSFNRITVDGDTSTNDSCLLVATGASGVVVSQEQDCSLLEQGLERVFLQLATELIRDAEGATKFVSIRVVNGVDSSECLAVAYAIAESPLVKTALFASDPNWGRILAAVGRAGLKDLDIERITIDLGQTRLVEAGGLAHTYTEELGQVEMDKEDITVTIDLGRGDREETVWTSDLSEDYVRINADYRS
ncbi:MAG: bifunctional glutamate N-acetyltransferase/amino-acid acetyltransferase ArgJ [Gammaproteobacteria bacterium]|nr:bifunctional glutamate N-acetyltransferase/amino-acid acetyltransferase ArgJ [Pseudomonadales bacterium]MCP5345573.1 bifunctional glutamate N-acetyltransferase/amino-acid acetyltransferase ArgJ [Pseudomonadales bacterium]